MSLDRLRELLGRPGMPEDEAQRCRQFLYDLAGLLVEDYRAEKEGRPLDLP